MGQRYRGPHQEAMAAQLQEARDYIDNQMARDFPNHRNWFHLIHRGISYHFYIDNVENQPDPAHLDVQVSVRIVRDELFDIELDDHHPNVRFNIPNGETAARVQTFDVQFELENIPAVQRIYKHWLHFGHEHPQFANVIIVLA